jgi:hypothetical protein
MLKYIQRYSSKFSIWFRQKYADISAWSRIDIHLDRTQELRNSKVA